jgi:hypothetical protein
VALSRVVITSKRQHTWKSPSEEANEYKRVTDVNWIIEYNALEKNQ